MRLSSIPIIALAALLMAPMASFARSCPDAIAALRAALTSASLEEVEAIYRNQVQTLCFGREAGFAARSVALRHVKEATRMAASAVAPAARLAVLRQGERFSDEPWQLHDAIGDALLAMGDYSGAATSYQLAMNKANALAEGLAEPPREALQTLIGKAQQARLLATSLIDLPRDARDNSLGGLGLRSLRGLQVKRVAQPIHFVTDTDDPTPEGTKAIQQLQELLKEKSNPRITLVGHTDERGSHEYNDALSMRRAERVKQILEAGDKYPKGAILVEGLGKRQPFTIVAVEGVTFSQPQRWQLDRRVELVW